METKEFFAMAKSIDKPQRRIDIVANAKTMDRDYEIIHPKAFESFLPKFMENPVVLECHNHYGEAVGKFVDITTDENGLKGTIEFAPTEKGERYWQLYSGGYQRAFSVGFMAKEWKDVVPDTIKDNKVELTIGGESVSMEYSPGLKRVFTDVELLETSCVPIPCNRESLSQLAYTGFKSLAKALEQEDNFEPKAVYDQNGDYVGLEIKLEDIDRLGFVIYRVSESELEQFKSFHYQTIENAVKGEPTTIVFGVKDDKSVLVAESYPDQEWAQLELQTELDEDDLVVLVDVLAEDISEIKIGLKELTTVSENIGSLKEAVDNINESILSLANLIKTNKQKEPDTDPKLLSGLDAIRQKLNSITIK